MRVVNSPAFIILDKDNLRAFGHVHEIAGGDDIVKRRR